MTKHEVTRIREEIKNYFDSEKKPSAEDLYAWIRLILIEAGYAKVTTSSGKTCGFATVYHNHLGSKLRVILVDEINNWIKENK